MKHMTFTRSRAGIYTAIGIVLSVMSGLLLIGYVTQKIGGGEGPRLEVPVANCGIEAGSLIDPGMIACKNMPELYMVPGSILDIGEITGSRALRYIGEGEPFIASALSGRGNGNIAMKIPEDFRAYPLTLINAPGPGPGVQPGDRVDLLATSGDPPRTRTLLREILVLEILNNEDGQGASREPARMMLLISPEEAEQLAQAEYEGEISISLCPVRPDD